MGSEKGLYPFKGKPFIKHILETMQPLVSEIIIVSNNSDYDSFGFQRVEDYIINAGPLAGLYSGLMASETDHNLVLSCDVPLITSEVLERLIDLRDSSFEVIQIESQGETMPLVALYKKQCATTLGSMLKSGERRLRSALKQLSVINIELEPELEPFVMNINTPEQLKEIRHESDR